MLISILAGCLGAILGIGGGMIIIPVLTLGFDLGIQYAVGASLVSVIATSCGAAAIYVRDRLTNIRLAIFLEIATTLGAISGVALSSVLRSSWLFLLFSMILLHAAYLMFSSGKKPEASRIPTVQPGSWMAKLRLDSFYFDTRSKKEVPYSVVHIPLGFAMMAGAGILSGLLGIGSGAFKVLAMDRTMRVPIKVSSATSNFMIGVTAAASASAYYFKGSILPEVAGPVAIGVLIGAAIGTRLLLILPSAHVRKVFSVVLVVIAVQMAMRGLGYGK